MQFYLICFNVHIIKMTTTDPELKQRSIAVSQIVAFPFLCERDCQYKYTVVSDCIDECKRPFVTF